MTVPWVATKVSPPRLRSSHLARPRIATRLATAREAKLTLVSAPAGFGKTTALAAWLAGDNRDDRAVAWVSLEEGDSEPARFWTYVVRALQSVDESVGAAVLPVLDAGQQPARGLLASVVNDIGDLRTDVDLVLDDYHLADGPGVADGMTFLLEHQPPNLRVVISTRADPDLPLARLRARGELVEVRVRELRFTDQEVAAYLTEVSGIVVSSDDVATLAGRTEGWAAALQLASLSMQDRDDVAGFVAGFAGDDRYVVDYLVDEVLSRQPDDVCDFLLRTSVLERLEGRLCDAVTGTAGSRAMLERLERDNLLLVPLDDQRRWYRYHHLFADVLQAHLEDRYPGERRLLHRRASDWYADAGEPVAAVRHALAAGALDRAADLAEQALPALQRLRREGTIRAWADDFPDEVVRQRPVLALGLVGGLMQCNEFAAAEARLPDVERWLPAIRRHLGGSADVAEPATGPTDLVFLDEDELARVPAAVEMYRAALALVHGDPAATVRHAARTLAEAVPGDDLARGAASALSGLASWAVGDLDAAHRAYSTAIEHLRSAGHLADVLGCTITLADIRIAQGRLTEALHVYDNGLRLATQSGEPLRGAADMHVGIAEVALERGDAETARRHLQQAHELGEPLGLPQLPYRKRASSAVLAEADGDLRTALDLLTEAEARYVGDYSPDVRPLHARKARVAVALGDLEAADRWAVDHAHTSAQPPSYAHEHELVTLAEVLVGQHRRTGDRAVLTEAGELLERIRAAAEEGGRTGTVIEVLVLQALAAQAARDEDQARSRVGQAIALAEPEGQVRPFSRHPGTRTLLDLVETRSPFAERLRAACTGAGHRAPARPAPPASGVLIDPLSARELEVLRLLDTDLDGPDIARHLVVSLNTLRTHTKKIYSKLGVSNRRAALHRAHELGLLPTR